LLACVGAASEVVVGIESQKRRREIFLVEASFFLASIVFVRGSVVCCRPFPLPSEVSLSLITFLVSVLVMVEWSLRCLHSRGISMQKGELDILGWRKSPC
jgi:hypothetical protein